MLAMFSNLFIASTCFLQLHLALFQRLQNALYISLCHRVATTLRLSQAAQILPEDTPGHHDICNTA